MMGLGANSTFQLRGGHFSCNRFDRSLGFMQVFRNFERHLHLLATCLAAVAVIGLPCRWCSVKIPTRHGCYRRTGRQLATFYLSSGSKAAIPHGSLNPSEDAMP